MTDAVDRAPDTLIVCGIAGSIRRGSYNRALLRAACDLAPAMMEIRVFDRVAEIPPFNADVEAQGDPEPVRTLKAAIAEADAFLLASPEYNHGIPGVMKNVIDWASRPAGRSVLAEKPTALMGATPGTGGTSKAQMALRQSFVFTRTPVLVHPQVLVSQAHDKFDAGGLHDKGTRDHIAALLRGLEEWTAKLQCDPVQREFGRREFGRRDPVQRDPDAPT